jgi:hypothetical protein
LGQTVGPGRAAGRGQGVGPGLEAGHGLVVGRGLETPTPGQDQISTASRRQYGSMIDQPRWKDLLVMAFHLAPIL